MRTRTPGSVRARDELRAMRRRGQRLQYDAVIGRWARALPSGRPLTCTPSIGERQGFEPRKEGERADGAPIFGDEAAAGGCADELLRRFGGTRLVPYRCGRSRSGQQPHWHLGVGE